MKVVVVEYTDGRREFTYEVTSAEDARLLQQVHGAKTFGSGLLAFPQAISSFKTGPVHRAASSEPPTPPVSGARPPDRAPVPPPEEWTSALVRRFADQLTPNSRVLLRGVVSSDDGATMIEVARRAGRDTHGIGPMQGVYNRAALDCGMPCPIEFDGARGRRTVRCDPRFRRLAPAIIGEAGDAEG